MTAEASETVETTESRRRGVLAAQSAEDCDLSTTDATPTVTAVGGGVLVPRALYVGVAGDVKVDMAGGQTVTFKALAQGIHPLAVTKVYKIGTAATDL